MIANVFPLSHRSGVNYKGTYNERSTNTIDEDVEMIDESQNSLLGEGISERLTLLSHDFFVNFWLLQGYIADPFQVSKS